MNPPDLLPVEAVAVKLPTFDPTDPELWFIQCEVRFRNKNVKKDQIKYTMW